MIAGTPQPTKEQDMKYNFIDFIVDACLGACAILMLAIGLQLFL